MFKEMYDIIVVGGGPAGSMAAYEAAKLGASVLLLEKDRQIGTPVRCAEAVGKDGIEKLLESEIDHRWVMATIKKFQFVAPDETVIYPQVPMTGYVLDRKLFDYDLARRAANAGCQILTGAYVNGIIHQGNKIAGVSCRYRSQTHQIKCKIVVGADGVESRIARWAGLDTTVPLKDMETCSQMTLANLDIRNDTCIFYFSQKKFPGGYAWLFPKGDGTANVGLGISGDHARKGSADERLKLFVEEKFPFSSVLNKIVGGVPCARRLPKISADGIMLVGDAALQANPISGGGIATGMTAGKIAGKVAGRALKTGDYSDEFFMAYEREWDKTCGNAQKRYYRLKEGIRRLSDEQLNKTAQSLQKLPQEKQTLVRIFQTALIHQPSLLVDIIKTLSPFSA